MRAAATLSACTRTKNHPGQCTAHALLHSAENLDTQRGEEGCMKRAGLVCRAHQYNVAAHRYGRTACVAAHIAMTSPSGAPGLDTRSTSVSSPGTAVNAREAAYEGKPPELDFTFARLCNGEILTRSDSPRHPNLRHPPIDRDVCRCTSYGNPTVHKN